MTDITHHNGWLWIAQRQTRTIGQPPGPANWLVGVISRFQPSNPVASFTAVLKNFPSTGDHYTEEVLLARSKAEGLKK